MLDKFSPRRHAEARTWAAENDVELVFSPTNGSWLNLIDSEFAALRYFALNGTDHRTHDEQNAGIAGYIRWCNARAGRTAATAATSPNEGAAEITDLHVVLAAFVLAELPAEQRVVERRLFLVVRRLERDVIEKESFPAG